MWRGCLPRVKYLLFLMSLITTFLVGRDLISAKLAAWKAKYKAFVILSRADFIDIFQSVELLPDPALPFRIFLPLVKWNEGSENQVPTLTLCGFV